ncbi:hypothetical protein B0H13DRAFT_595994 [Mycena leptocephala]|nr:hypothetical protein B0H13DRAFT_595994 [Mycena leptocephala]
MLFALAYGSFGDLLETAKLAVKVAQFMRDGGRLSQERLALAAELQTLSRDLLTLDAVASGVHLDPSCTRSLFIVTRIGSEVKSCRAALAGFLDKLFTPRGVFGIIVASFLEERQVTKLRTDISGPLNAIRILMSTLNLSTSRGIRSQLHGTALKLEDIGARVERIETHILAVGDRLEGRIAAYHEAVLELSIPRGVLDDMFCVIDPVGGNIPIPLRYCRVYADMDRILKTYLGSQPEAGGRYVQRGDYGIVSAEGKVIVPVDFRRTVRAGMQVEMSIVKRRLQNRSDQTQKTQCPHCQRKNTNEPDNDWFTWCFLPQHRPQVWGKISNRLRRSRHGRI